MTENHSREPKGIRSESQTKAVGITGWIEACVAAKGEITLDELATELAETHGIDVHRGTVWRVLRGLGLTHKKRPSGA